VSRQCQVRVESIYGRSGRSAAAFSRVRHLKTSSPSPTWPVAPASCGGHLALARPRFRPTNEPRLRGVTSTSFQPSRRSKELGAERRLAIGGRACWPHRGIGGIPASAGPRTGAPSAEPTPGLEPGTGGLQNHCSTVELGRRAYAKAILTPVISWLCCSSDDPLDLHPPAKVRELRTLHRPRPDGRFHRSERVRHSRRPIRRASSVCAYEEHAASSAPRLAPPAQRPRRLS
jgi:hypothetical protein